MMPRFLAALAALATLAALVAPLSLAAQEPPEPLREVNITQGSEPGWIPDEALETETISTWKRYFALLEAGDYQAAHAMHRPEFRETYPLDAYRTDQRAAREKHGAQLSRRHFRLTWTKDAPGTPFPGTFVAIDNIARYERAERHCGYVVLHRAPGAEEFTVLRVEDNLLADESAETIARVHSPLQRDLVWRLLARNCPGYTPSPLPEEAVAACI